MTGKPGDEIFLDKKNPHVGGQSMANGKKLLFFLILLIAFIEGAAVMVIEITAARIMTPYFGQSVFVWTNIIGIILASVAIGNYFGGRLADKSKTLLPLFICLLLSGLFCLISPFLIKATAGLFINEKLQLEEAFTLLIRGSFATALMLFAPPVLFAGACLPFLVKSAANLSGQIGRASGTVYGVSTFGSIVGTFLSTYFLLELFGSKITFFLSGAVLILIAALGLIFCKNAKLRVMGISLSLILIFICIFDMSPDRSFKTDDKTIWEKESKYQYVKAVKVDSDPETIHLCINEGLDSFHSIYIKDQILTNSQYYDYYCLLPPLAGIEELGPVCIIGLAAGTIARQYDHFYANSKSFYMDGVELDPVTVTIGKELMDLKSVSDNLNIFPDIDGRVFLETVNTKYDVVIVDAYSKQIYIPFHIATQEFFQAIYEHLRDGGIMGMNVNGFTRDDKVITAIANTAASVFGSVSVARIPWGRNYMIYAIKGKGHEDPCAIDTNLVCNDLKHLHNDISSYSMTREYPYDPNKIRLTDDRAPLERLCNEDLLSCASKLIEQVEGLNR